MTIVFSPYILENKKMNELNISLWQLESLANQNGIEIKLFASYSEAREYYIEQLQNVVRRVLLCHLGSLSLIELNTFLRCDCGIKIPRHKKVTIAHCMESIENDIEFWIGWVFGVGEGGSFFKQSFLDKFGIKTLN
jgi:hypothetical protein